MARQTVSNKITIEILARLLRTRKKSALAQIAADYVEDHPDAKCVQNALSWLRDRFVDSFTNRLRWRDDHVAQILSADIPQCALINLAIACIMGDIAMVTRMEPQINEWTFLLENYKDVITIMCEEEINGIMKWLLPQILYRLRAR